MSSRRLTKKLDLCAAARLSHLMREREAAGKSTVTPSTAKAVLWSLVNWSDDEGVCWPSIATIADDADASERTVQRVIALLEDERILQVRDRTKGAGAGQKREGERGATNLYRLDWDALELLARPGRKNARQDDARSDQDGRHADVRTDDTLASERTPAETGTDASGDRNGRQPSAPLRRNLLGTAIDPPPAPTGGEQRGGDRFSDTPAETSTIRDFALAVLEAYPTTTSDVYERDLDAVGEAIELERTTSERITWSEMRDAAVAVRKAAPTNPMYLRNWAKGRGYVTAALTARAVAEAAAKAQAKRDAAVGRDDADRAAAAAERQRVDGVISSLTDEEIERFRVLAIDQATPFQRRLLEGADLVKSRALRLAIAGLAEAWRRDAEQRGAA